MGLIFCNFWSDAIDKWFLSLSKNKPFVPWPPWLCNQLFYHLYLYNLLPPVGRPKYDTDHSHLTSIDVWTHTCGTGSNKAVSGQSMVLNFTVWLEAGVSRMASLLTDDLILRILYSSSTHFVPQKVMLRKVANCLQVFWHNLQTTFLKLTIMLIVLFWL